MPGGQVNSQVKQAQYNFVGASDKAGKRHRNVVQTGRSSFNNVNVLYPAAASTPINRPWCLHRASGCDGSRITGRYTYAIVDVLDATTTLYNAKQQLSSARYQYPINQLNIKQALGTR